ncbi:MAG TPA: sugar ABC transporter ATP-binding protein [Baekduia sp.]|jgi:ribose transport system ATP-binding protein
MNAPVIQLQHASKTFTGTLALRDVDLDIRRGEVHGLVGQNGSGKSTLIKILSGFHEPDAGTRLTVRGEEQALPLPPGRFSELGLAFVHQDLALIDTLSLLDNVRVGQYRAGLRPIGWREERRRLREALKRFDLPTDPDAPVSSLRDVDRALLAIMRAVQQLEGVDGGLLVLDEPTVYLPRDGVDRLFGIVRDIAARGDGVLLVTHQLGEIKAVTDRVTVLRDAQRIATVETADVDEEQLIQLILGRELEDLYPDHETVGGGAVNLVAREVRGRSMQPFSLELRAGEIVGVTGLAGTGFEDVPYLLFGAHRPDGGTITIGGQEIDARAMTPQRAVAALAALVPGNRARDGAAQPLKVRENVSLPVLDRYFRGGRIAHGQERSAVDRLLRDFDVRPADPERQIATLSGGNQQKAILAKWLQLEPLVLLMHEPTQGVDIGARKQIFSLTREAAERGTAVLVASTEYEDLANICDRVLVVRDGVITAEIGRSNLSEDRIVEQCYRTGTVAA